MKKNTLEASYQAYLRQRAGWEEKGYSLFDEKSFEQYRQMYYNAVSEGIQNIARTFASEDRKITYKQIRTIRRKIGEYYEKGYEVKRLIHEGEPGFVSDKEKRYRKETIKLSDIEDFDISEFSVSKLKGMSAGDIYNRLLDFSLDEREAGGVIDELYREGVIRKV